MSLIDYLKIDEGCDWCREPEEGSETICDESYEPATPPAISSPGRSVTPVTLLLWIVAIFTWAKLLVDSLTWLFSEGPTL
jgi:hypothetical protein